MISLIITNSRSLELSDQTSSELSLGCTPFDGIRSSGLFEPVTSSFFSLVVSCGLSAVIYYIAYVLSSMIEFRSCGFCAISIS